MNRVSIASSLVVAVGLLAGQAAVADVVTIGASKDNSLFEDAAGALSNGAGPHMYAGKTGPIAGSLLRRALLAFDVAGNVPPGATITSATLSLNQSASAPASGNQTINLHRVLSDWGESTSDAGRPGGAGATSAPGDASWIHAFFNTTPWGTTGGDFVGISSAAAVAGVASGPRVWGSTPDMVADVQGWLDNPGSAFGWMLIGDEITDRTARRFDSRENPTPSLRPMLTIEFDPPKPIPTMSEWGMIVFGLLLCTGGSIVFGRRRRVASSS